MMLPPPCLTLGSVFSAQAEQQLQSITITSRKLKGFGLVKLKYLQHVDKFESKSKFVLYFIQETVQTNI